VSVRHTIVTWSAGLAFGRDPFETTFPALVSNLEECPKMSTTLVLLVLAAVWCGYLATWWRDSRRQAARRGNQITNFSSGMGTLGGSSVSSAVGSLGMAARQFELMPRSINAAARRRQQIVTGLAGAAAVTLLASFVFGAPAVLLHVMIDMALGGYAYAMVQRRNLAAEREIKVQMLHPERVASIAGRRLVNG